MIHSIGQVLYCTVLYSTEYSDGPPHGGLPEREWGDMHVRLEGKLSRPCQHCTEVHDAERNKNITSPSGVKG